ncbi:MAG: ABC transporter ATP-binding protein [Fimbriimonadaceae bacterium]
MARLSEPLIAEGLQCGYGEKVILDDLSFNLEAGRVYCMLGPNGSGKSTLLQTLVDILPKIGGSCRIGETFNNQPSFCKLCAFVPQSEFARFPFTVLEVVLMGTHARYQGFFDSQQQVDTALQAAESLDVAHLLQRPITELSGGERQRVYLARALAQEPDWYLLDEPTSHQDVSHVEGLVRLIGELKRQGKGVVVAVHDVSLALHLADEVLLLAEGKVAWQGASKDPELVERLSAIYRVRFEKVGIGDSDEWLIPIFRSDSH